MKQEDRWGRSQGLGWAVAEVACLGYPYNLWWRAAGGRREEGGVASGEVRRCEWEVGGIWVRMYGGQKEKEGEVAVATSPSYK